MQIRAYILLLIFCGAAAAAAENLCPEWENPLTTPNGVRLAKWRFSEWGVRQDPRKKIIRSARTALIDGKPAVTLESSNALNSANILFRTVPLKAGNSGKFRLSLTAVNASSRKALLKINFSTPGKKPFSAAHYAAVSEKPEEKSKPESKQTGKGKQYMTQSLSKYNKKEQKLISHIYGILKAILPRDTATMVINKIQEELSK